MNRIVLMVWRNLCRVPHAYWKLCRNAKHVDSVPEQERYDHIQYMMQLAVRSGNIDLQLHGLENLPKENGYLIYGNHQGLFDVVALVATHPGPMSCVFKKELANVPFLKQIIACTRSLSMDREDVRQSLEVIRKVTEEVKAGRNYLIFPEGTRSRNGNHMNEFHGGSFRCALKAKCPVVPMAVVNSYQVLDQKGSRPVSMQLHYLPPIPYAEYQNLKTVELAELVKSRIQAVLDANT